MSNSFLDSLSFDLDGNVSQVPGASKPAVMPAFDMPEDEPGIARAADGGSRLFDRGVIWQESRGRQFDSNGNPLTSKAGAIGIAQVMPGTAPEAARLAGLPWDEKRYRTDPDYNASLGRAYFNKQLSTFGDEGMALAAYNAGPGRVQSALRKASQDGNPGAWLSYLPAETRDYVPKIMGKVYGAGSEVGGGQAKPQPRPQPASASFLDRFSTDDILNMSLNSSDGMVESSLTPPKERTWGEAVMDPVIGAATGIYTGVKSISDAFGADNPVSEFSGGVIKALQGAQSQARQVERQNRQAKIQEAEDSGNTWDEIVANVGAFADAPLETTLNALGSSAPTLLASVIPGIGQVNAARFIMQGAIGAAQGAGAVKGSIYEKVQERLEKDGMSKSEAAKVAAGAQAYDSQNAGQIALGALLGAVAGTSGIENTVGKLASRRAGGEVVEQASRDVLARTGIGILKESPIEGFQGGQERVASNIALQNLGYNEPTFKGAIGQGFGEAVASAGPGAIGGYFDKPAAPATPAPNGPLTRALNAGAPVAQPAPQAPTEAAPAAATPPAPPAAPPVAPPDLSSPVSDLGQEEIDPEMAAMADTDLDALIAGIESKEEVAVSDDDWVRYYLAKEEIKRRKTPQATAAVTPTQEAAPQAPESPAEQTAEAAPEPAGTYMPGAEINAKRPKEQPKVVLQNRDRSGAASVQQMSGIASNPDFLRIGPSTEMTTGAPVVFGDLPATAVKGRPETVVDGKGDRIQAQYVVVDARDLIASNNADGTPVESYVNGLPGKLRAVAGNGRTAGIQKAYQQGTAEKYRQDLIEQAQTMGLDAAAIEAMQQPVLVRVMDAADVRDDMGDRTNITGTQRLSPVEQAANDARRLNLADLSFDENGNPTQETLRRFINTMPDAEKGDLIAGKEGTPTRQAAERLMAATFKQAYDSDELVELYAQAPEPEARAILNAAAEAAGALSALKEMNPDFDVREAVAGAVKMAVNASRQQKPLAEFAQNADLDTDPDAFAVARFLGKYANKPRQMANGLREWARDVLGQAEIDRTNQSQGGLFGAQPTLTRDQLFARLGNIDPNDQATIQAREALAKRDAEKVTTQEQAPTDAAPEAVPEAPGFDLEAQTPEQLQAQADERAAEEKRQRDAEQAAEAKAQADAELGDFTLTGSDRPADANPNQGDLLAADQPQQGDVLNNVGLPFKFRKAAEQAAKNTGAQVVPVQGGFVVRMPQNMSGTPSATMGTRTDAKAGPGFTAADVVRRDPIAGQKINDEWTAFAPQSGTLGIPRAEMPQVKAQDRGAMVNFLKARGIDSSKEQLPPTALKPTQAEFSPAKVQEAADRTDGDRSIIVSADGHVVDGHHQWLAQRQKGEPINVIRLDQPITQVLGALKQMPSAQPGQKQDVALTNEGDKDGALTNEGTMPESDPQVAGDGAAPSGDADAIAGAIQQSIAERSLGASEKFYREQVAKRLLSQESADAEMAKARDRWSKSEPTERTKMLAKAIAEKDPRPLVDAWAMDGRGIAGSEGSISAFEKFSGLKLSRLPSAGRAKAIFGWAGWSDEQASAYMADRSKAKADADAAYEAKYQAEVDARVSDRAGKELVHVRDTDTKLPIREYVDGLISQGFNRLTTAKKGAITKTYLADDAGRGYELPPGLMREYAQAALRNADRGAKKDQATQAEESKPNQPQAQQTRAASATETVAPEVGPFGPILTQYYHDAQGAIKALTALQNGEAVAALYHPDVGDIDLVWGKEGTSNSDGLGLAKLVKWHPEVLGDLQGFLNRLRKDEATSGPNRIRLVDGQDKAVVRLQWDGKAKNWLLTAFESNAPKDSTRTDTGAADVKDDTASLNPERNQSVPPTDAVAQPVTRADVAAAERLAADMIRQKIDGMKAGEVQRIAARFLPTMGKKAPVGKAKIADAMTDVSAFSLLNPAAELGVELSESVKHALTADREGRVVDVAQDDGATKKAAEAQTENPTKTGVFFHSGLKIYPVTLNVGGEVKSMWAVQTLNNAEREANGERQLGGDPVSETIDGAKRLAEAVVASAKQLEEHRAAMAAMKAERAAAEAARKEANQGKTLSEIKAQKYLDAPVVDGETGERMTRAEWVKRRIEAGDALDTWLENKIKDKSRREWDRMDNQEQAAHEAKVREGGQVSKYRIGEYTVTKTEYDYAQKLLADKQAVAEPNPLEHTPKQYADAWLRWSAETNGLPLAEVREMQGDEAGLKNIEQRWVDAVVNQAKSGQSLPAKTLDKLLEIRPNTVLPESAIPAGYQRPEARKLEKAQKSAPAENELEAIFSALEAEDGLKKRRAKSALKERPDAEVINQVESQFYDMLLSLMERGDLEVNGHKKIHEDNKSCL